MENIKKIQDTDNQEKPKSKEEDQALREQLKKDGQTKQLDCPELGM